MTGINSYVTQEEDYYPDEIDWEEFDEKIQEGYSVFEITRIGRCDGCPEWCIEEHDCPHFALDTSDFC